MTIFSNCEKKQIEPQNYFEVNVNNNSELFKPKEASVEKGITEITACDEIENTTRTIVITVNTDAPGKYHQYFDYKTGVSRSQCGLIYELLENADDKAPVYFKSIEGQVEITDINHRKKLISGFYRFKIRSLSDMNIPNSIKGTFINISYK